VCRNNSATIALVAHVAWIYRVPNYRAIIVPVALIMKACCVVLALMAVLGSCFGAPKVSHEEAASAEVVSKRWPKVPFHGASAF
jgi:hypothetical protein